MTTENRTEASSATTKMGFSERTHDREAVCKFVSSYEFPYKYPFRDFLLVEPYLIVLDISGQYSLGKKNGSQYHNGGNHVAKAYDNV